MSKERWTEEEALKMNVAHRIPVDMRQEELTALQKLGQGIILEPYRTQRLTQTGTRLTVLVTATTLINESNQIYAIATTEQKINN